MKYLNKPVANIDNSIVFKTINALSCHIYPTYNQPAVPIVENIISYTFGTSSTDLHSTAAQINTTETHFTNQVRSCNGVTFFILFCVLVINFINYVVGCYKGCTFRHIF